MKIEVLHIDGCPSWIEAGKRLQEALVTTGHADTTVSYRVLRTPEDAGRVAFAGSPTITLDGRDLFPSDGGTTDLACRIYPTPEGLSGLPTTEQLREAITTYDR
jgi:hypothetical protein